MHATAAAASAALSCEGVAVDMLLWTLSALTLPADDELEGLELFLSSRKSRSLQ